MNILLIGSGGREHAFAWKISQSKKCTKLFIAPGNPGTSECGENVNIDINNFEALGQFCLINNVSMLVVGPEDPLVNGIHDYFLAHADLKKIGVIGPQKDGAMLEGSKDFSKKFMQKYAIPTAGYESFTSDNIDAGIKYLQNHTLPIVLKADGLAAGKGVLILNDREEAISEFKSMLNGKFGNAGSTVVVEEFLPGIECSVFVLSDGISYKILPEAKDYKRIGEGDEGLNTGGMGSISPVPFATKEFMDKVEERIIIPTVNGLKKENIEYKGFIFIGLIKVKEEPYVIEYNCRMGDPETESVLPRIESDFLDLLEGVMNQTLASKEIKISSQSSSTVILVSGGYPGDYQKGKIISGLDKIEKGTIFHSGTAKDSHGNIVSNGGRVLACTSLGNTLQEALEISNANAKNISFDGKNFRKDIGYEWKKLD